MSAEEFREHGHALIDWVANYLEKVESYPIQSRVRPGEIRAKLPEAAPEHPEPFESILRDLDEIILPGITHWQSPGWFAYFPGNASPPAILGELASAGLNVQGMLWSTSPAATELESVVMDWLVGLLGLPPAWKSTGPGGGVIQPSASDSTHTALVVAGTRRLGGPRSPRWSPTPQLRPTPPWRRVLGSRATSTSARWTWTMFTQCRPRPCEPLSPPT